MLVLLSPAKNMKFDPMGPDVGFTQPELLEDAKQLATAARALSQAQLKRLMNISDKLAALNYERFQAFITPFTPDNARPAALTFNGDAFRGLDADSLTPGDLAWAQDHLRILSGLYGLLRPLDLIQPYRLEMGRSLANPRGDDLYAFWATKLTGQVNQAMARSDSEIIVNLASKEYFSALESDDLKGRVITPQFKEIRNGKAQSLSFFMKKARGLMTRYIIQHRLDDASKLKKFDLEGYRFNPSLSEGDIWVFTRQEGAA